jgi:hypothetical protein
MHTDIHQHTDEYHGTDPRNVAYAQFMYYLILMYIPLNFNSNFRCMILHTFNDVAIISTVNTVQWRFSC